jgi:hypothetical protein
MPEHVDDSGVRSKMIVAVVVKIGRFLLEADSW